MCGRVSGSPFNATGLDLLRALPSCFEKRSPGLGNCQGAPRERDPVWVAHTFFLGGDDGV